MCGRRHFLARRCATAEGGGCPTRHEKRCVPRRRAARACHVVGGRGRRASKEVSRLSRLPDWGCGNSFYHELPSGARAGTTRVGTPGGPGCTVPSARLARIGRLACWVGLCGRTLADALACTGAPCKQDGSVKVTKTRSDARVNKRTEARAGGQTRGAAVIHRSAQAACPERRKPLFGGLVCACPCGCASRTTVASQEQPLVDSAGAELCSECFGNIKGPSNTMGSLCRLLALLK